MSSTQCRPVHRETRRETRREMRRETRREGYTGGKEGRWYTGGKVGEGTEYRRKEGQRVHRTEERVSRECSNPGFHTDYIRHIPTPSLTHPVHHPYKALTKHLQSVRSWCGWQRTCRASATNTAPLRAAGGRDNERRPPSVHGCMVE